MNKKNHHMTLQERQEIEKHLRRGLGLFEIVKRIGRSESAIYKELKRNGGKKTYSAELAQNLANSLQQEKNSRLCLARQNKNSDIHTQQRIENLEMQVEILHETIKELMKR